MSTRKSASTSQPDGNEKVQSKPDNSGEIPRDAKAGSLVVIGTGIRTVGQLTIEAIAWMQEADSLLYVVADSIAEAVIKHLNPTGAVSLAGYYEEGKPRINTYSAMVEHILRCVRAGNKTVAAFYGHPGVCTYPSHESIRIARSEGFPARMLPGISSEDCLFADLGIDPGTWGCQSYEATDFLLNTRLIDPSSPLILWQLGALGFWKHKSWEVDMRAMPLLVKKLKQFYPVSHPLTLYQAAILPETDPIIVQIPLHSLSESPITAGMTLYIPPAQTRIPDPEMSRLLSLIKD